MTRSELESRAARLADAINYHSAYGGTACAVEGCDMIPDSEIKELQDQVEAGWHEAVVEACQQLILSYIPMNQHPEFKGQRVDR